MMAIEDQTVYRNVIDNVNVTGKMWLSGRRKDYGPRWTWVSEHLEDVEGGNIKLPEEYGTGDVIINFIIDVVIVD